MQIFHRLSTTSIILLNNAIIIIIIFGLFEQQLIQTQPTTNDNDERRFTYDNLYNNCLKKETKRLEQFSNYNINNNNNNFCNKTKLLEGLQTHIQQTICNVFKYTTTSSNDHRKSKRRHIISMKMRKRTINFNFNNATDIYKKIFEYMTHHLIQLSLMQENYALGNNNKNDNKGRSIHQIHHQSAGSSFIENLKRLEKLLFNLKENILKKLIYISQCEKFSHECHRLQPSIVTTSNNNNNNNHHHHHHHHYPSDIGSKSRFEYRYLEMLKKYEDDLKNSLSLLSTLSSSYKNIDASEIADIC